MPVLERPLTRVCIRLWEDDYEAIREIANGEVSINLIIRQVVHSFVVHSNDKKRRKLDQIPAPTVIDIDLSALELESEEATE